MKKKIMLLIIATMLFTLASCGKKPAPTPAPSEPVISDTAQTQNPTENTEESISANPVESPEQDYRLTSYAVVMGTYYTAINENWGFEKLMENDLSELILNNPQNVGYAFLDFNKDGVDELIFGDLNAAAYPDNIIYDMYALVDGVETHVFSSHERDRYYLGSLTEDGDDFTLLRFGSSGAGSSIYEGTNWGENRLTVYQAVRYEAEDANPWMMGTEVNGEVVFHEAIDEQLGTAIFEAARANSIAAEYKALMD